MSSSTAPAPEKSSEVSPENMPRRPGKRAFDLLVVCILIPILLLPILLISLLIKLTSKGPVLYWSDRVGRYNKIFKMPKFRSMRIGTPVVATHLLTQADAYITPVGKFLRKTSLDELPQLWNILKGEISLVGPRPALYNQDDLVALRNERGVQYLVPGITGWAQVNGRDTLPIPIKVNFDAEYVQRQSFLFDLKIIVLTFVKVLKGDDVQH